MPVLVPWQRPLAWADVPTWIQAVAWGDVPTWIQAVATVLALIAAAVAAVTAWKVLGVERGRDAEQRAAEERRQAERVAAWPTLIPSLDVPRAFMPGALVQNGSDLPVYQVEVVFIPLHGGGWFSARSELVEPGSNPFERPAGFQGHLGTYRIALRFTDAAGRNWQRDAQGVLSRLPGDATGGDAAAPPADS